MPHEGGEQLQVFSDEFAMLEQVDIREYRYAGEGVTRSPCTPDVGLVYEAGTVGFSQYYVGVFDGSANEPNKCQGGRTSLSGSWLLPVVSGPTYVPAGAQSPWPSLSMHRGLAYAASLQGNGRDELQGTASPATRLDTVFDSKNHI